MDNTERSLYLECVGAGTIEIGLNATSVCGSRAGFNFGVSWGSHGYAGGLLPIGEAKKLIQMLQSKIDELEDTEEEMVSKFFAAFR